MILRFCDSAILDFRRGITNPELPKYSFDDRFPESNSEWGANAECQDGDQGFRDGDLKLT